jgi:glutathione peroxidase
MRRVVLLALGALMLAACGDAGEAGAPAAATDTTVQPAGAADGSAALRPEASSSGASSSGASSSRGARATGVLRGRYKRLNGELDDLARYGGRVVLVVNTATECGYTPQFDGLEALYREHRGDGLVVLGFPANDFAGQEPRSDKEIATFCKANFGVTFPMFAKTHVLGDSSNPLFRELTAKAGAPEWNFNKYLLDRRGRVVARYGAGTEPGDPVLAKRIGDLLTARA